MIISSCTGMFWCAYCNIQKIISCRLPRSSRGSDTRGSDRFYLRMTTIIGIKAESGVEGIVLASDTQLNVLAEDEESIEKGSTRKIMYGKTWMIGCSGTYSRPFHVFQRMLLGQKRGFKEEAVERMISTAIQRYDQKRPHLEGPHFVEVNSLNTEARRDGAALDDLHSFILAVNSPRLDLWEVDEFGNLKDPSKVQDFDYFVIGSGSEKVKSYIDRLVLREKIQPQSVDIPAAIDICVGGLEAAEEDAYTGGLDIVVMTKENIAPYGACITEALLSAKKSKLAEIKGKYHPASEDIKAVPSS